MYIWNQNYSFKSNFGSCALYQTSSYEVSKIDRLFTYKIDKFYLYYDEILSKIWFNSIQNIPISFIER